MIKDWLPLSEAGYCILLALRNGNHGYGIMQDVESFSSGAVQLGPGTLYTALSKFEKRALIKAVPNTENPRQKRYCLTLLGKEVLQAEISRLRQLASLGETLFTEK